MVSHADLYDSSGPSGTKSADGTASGFLGHLHYGAVCATKVVMLRGGRLSAATALVLSAAFWVITPLLMRDEIRKTIVISLKSFGFSYVTMDLSGYRTGSMNEVLKSEEEP